MYYINALFFTYDILHVMIDELALNRQNKRIKYVVHYANYDNMITNNHCILVINVIFGEVTISLTLNQSSIN